MPGDLVVPFIFVPHGAPDPVEWKAAHPGWVKFPATFVPRRAAEAGPPQAEPLPAAPEPARRFPESLASEPPPEVAAEAVSPTTFDWSFWRQVKTVFADLFGIPGAHAQPAEPPAELPEEEPGRREDEAEPLPPAVRLEQYRQAYGTLQRLDRDNPALQSLQRPDGPIPTQAALDRLQAALAVAREQAARRLQVDRERPEGFPDQASLQRFVATLRADLVKGGVTDARIGLVGSSVTGRSFKTREPFRADSDLDVFVVSRQLFDRSPPRRSASAPRSFAISKGRDLARIGLPRNTVEQLRDMAGRDVSIMIYRDLDALLVRDKPYMALEGNGN